MLTLTPTAAEVVRTLVEHSPAPDSGGLRITAGEQTGDGVALELTLVEEPAPEDERVEQEGATVYLDPGAAELLDHKQLDAQVADDGVTFTVRDEDELDIGELLSRNGHGPKHRNGHGPA